MGENTVPVGYMRRLPGLDPSEPSSEFHELDPDATRLLLGGTPLAVMTFRMEVPPRVALLDPSSRSGLRPAAVGGKALTRFGTYPTVARDLGSGLLTVSPTNGFFDSNLCFAVGVEVRRQASTQYLECIARPCGDSDPSGRSGLGYLSSEGYLDGHAHRSRVSDSHSCLAAEEAYEWRRWLVILVLAGMLPAGIAVGKRGDAQLLRDQTRASNSQTFVTLPGLPSVTTLIRQIRNSAATTVLMPPIAPSAAQSASGAPGILLLESSLAWSLAFLTVVRSCANVLERRP